MFGFDMLVHGERGDSLTAEELAVFGVDWEALRGRPIPGYGGGTGQDSNPLVGSWVGRVGPPENLSHVELAPVVGSLTEAQVGMLYAYIVPYLQRVDRASLLERWDHALAFVHTLDPSFSD